MGAEHTFAGVIDLVRMKAIRWHDEDFGQTFDFEDIPSDFVAEATEMRETLIEAVAGEDDELLEKYLDGEAISEEELTCGIRVGTLNGAFVPVMCGTSLKNQGVQPLIDAVVDYLPSPLDVPPIEGGCPGERSGRKTGTEVTVPHSPLWRLRLRVTQTWTGLSIAASTRGRSVGAVVFIM